MPIARVDIQFAVVIRETDDSITFGIVLSNNWVQFQCVKLSGHREVALLAEQTLPLNPQMVFTAVNGRLVIFDPVSFQMFRIQENDLQIETKLSETNLIAPVGQHLLVAESSSSLGFDGHIKYHTDCRISAIAGSTLFRVIVYAAYDGWVTIVSLPRWKVVRKTSLDGEIATKLLVTESCGLILAFTHDHLFVLNINGLLVRKVPNHVDIRLWTGFVSNAGLDYVLYADGQNDIGWFEAMYPERKATLFRWPDVALIHYKKSVQSIIALSTHGLVKACKFSSEIPVVISPR
jgi:hypothetical protein